jgi:lipopolysaccharide transport system ATP-binding protein
MKSAVVSIRGVGKLYHLGRGKAHDTLRDQIVHGVQALAGRFQGKARRRQETDDDLLWALKDVSFDVNQGEVIGILGANGAGKSTLLKVLSQITEPTEGEIRIRGRIACLLEVGTGFHPELTGRENVYLNGSILGMSRAEIRAKFDEIVAFAGVERFLDTPVKRYSSGMYVRLAFAVAAHLEPEILVVDEVLAVGDAAFQRKSMGKMSEVAGQGRTVFFVSHNMGAIINFCHRGIVMERGRVKFDGGVREAVHHYNMNVLSSGSNGDHAPHVLYEQPVPEKTAFAITKLELFDIDGNPKPIVSTGDQVVIRVTYYASRKVLRGSINLQFNAYDGSRLLFLSMDPESGFPAEFLPGEHALECVIQSLPFAAGDYVIGGGLTFPYVEVLCWTPNFCRLTVLEHDFYGSGFPLKADRSLIVTNHYWRHI